MFVKLFAILCCLSFSAFAGAADNLEGKSAHREPNVSYRAYKFKAWMMSQGEQEGPRSRSAVESAISADKAAQLPVTLWNSSAELTSRFEHLRDIRFLHEEEKPNFPRRSSWLYPDDGCFARAALAVRNLTEWKNPTPNKIFVFGDLQVESKNAIGGNVTWWYHVAPIVQIGAEKYILDPAIEPKHPLKLNDWLLRMSPNPSQLEVAICGSGAYTPYDACEKDTDGLERSAEDDQMYFLRAEWERLEALRRDPVEELGDNPPWL
jgi:hypothetical protein